MAPSDHTLLITGATGYIGGHVIHQALARGYSIRAAVRSPSAIAKIRDTFPSYAAQLSFALTEGITDTEHFRDAFTEDVTGVIHLATPVGLGFEDPKRDVLDPAIRGAEAIIKATHEYGKIVQRLVNTSSMAAILVNSKGMRPGYTYSETDWNPLTYDEAATGSPLDTYGASKALAEKAQWDFLRQVKPSFSYVCVAPSVVYGPHLCPLTSLSDLNPSSSLVWTSLVDRQDMPPPDYCGIADIRNVAEALLNAFEVPEAAGQRFLLATHFDWQIAADEARGRLREERRARVLEGVPGSTREGRWRETMYAVDGGKAERVLGVRYRGVGETIGDLLEQIFEFEGASRESK